MMVAMQLPLLLPACSSSQAVPAWARLVTLQMIPRLKQRLALTGCVA
jgi:hypothetical protein